MDFKPLIIGGSHHNTYSLLRCFGEAGMIVDLILYGCKNSYIEYSKYINNLWYCKDVVEAYNKVTFLIKEIDNKYVIISATDADASMLDLHYEDLKNKCFFFNAGQPGLVTRYMNKEVQTEQAKRSGFAIPFTRSFKKGDSLMSDVYPCIVKPLASIDGGKRIAICHNSNELEECMAKFSDVEKVLIQQVVDKEEEIVILGLSYCNQITVPGYIIKYRDIDGGTTYSSTASIENLQDGVVKNAQRLIKALKYEGLFGIECIKSKEDYYFIEINLRNDATSYSLAVAGANLPLLYYKACIEGKLADSTCNVRKICSMVELKDFRHVLHGEIGLFTWLKQRKKAECRYDYSKEDCRPYKVARKEFLSHLMRRAFHL